MAFINLLRTRFFIGCLTPEVYKCHILNGPCARVSFSDVQPPEVYKSHILNGPIDKLYF